MTTLEHIGIAVEYPDVVATLLSDLLGLQTYKTETVQREGVRTHFLGAGQAKLELLESTGPDSAIARFLTKRGEGVHHLAFEVDDVDAVISRARDLGLRPLSDEPQPGADRKQIAFFHPRDTHGLLIEVCESVPLLGAKDAEEGVSTFGIPRSPAILIVFGGDRNERSLWNEVSGFLESRFFVVMAEVSDAIVGPGDAIEPLLGDTVGLWVIATPDQRLWAESYALRRGSTSVAICDAGTAGSLAISVVSLHDHTEYRIPPATSRSRESVRLLADLLARLPATDPS